MSQNRNHRHCLGFLPPRFPRRFILQDFRDWILDFDQAAAREFGRYGAEYEAARGADGLPDADVRDLQIAAIARSQGWTVATRNSKDYPFVDTVNPFAT
jgi:predicted nucleic acid-binding protein